MILFLSLTSETLTLLQVFGNSNSLPISLVLSLSKTLKGLHWDKVPGDNDNEVAARGILYLLIFQQLGQLVRWSWGYHVLLAPPDKYEGEDQQTDSQLEQGRYRDEPDDEDLLEQDRDEGSSDTRIEETGAHANGSSEYESGDQTPITHQRYSSSMSSGESSKAHKAKSGSAPELMATPANGNALPRDTSEQITSFPSILSGSPVRHEDIPQGIRGLPVRCKLFLKSTTHKIGTVISTQSSSMFNALPNSVQKVLARIYQGFAKFMHGVWEFMNPPLWAMLVAILVASVPPLQRLFFTEGTFVRNSVSRAVEQSGGVAVPLILVVLGANLARNTLPEEDHSVEDDKEERNLLIASLVSRMLLPIIIMAPILALMAKYVPVSILDDPIFVIVCFLLTGAPSALQLAQICQINGVYMGAMSRLLFQSYVVWYVYPITLNMAHILPTGRANNHQDLTIHTHTRHVCFGSRRVGSCLEVGASQRQKPKTLLVFCT